MKIYPLASVIIPNYNGEKVICDCLQSVYACDYPNFEVIVADDCSSDSSLAKIKQKFPQVQIIKSRRNRGFVRTVNRGIRNSLGEIIALLNMDTVVTKSWLSELVKVLIYDQDVAIAGSKILDLDGKTIQYAGGMIFDNGLSLHIGRGEMDQGQYNVLQEVDYVCGASMGFKRGLLKEVGYFDASYSPLYYEDADLAFRAKKAGKRVVFVPSSVLMHRENYSTQGLTARFYYRYHKSRLVFLANNYSLKYLLKDFLKKEFLWFRDFKPAEFKKQLILAYLSGMMYLPVSLSKRLAGKINTKRRLK
ncbi:MAG: glycosyltransferase family 2 protein [Candidatus Omnitrophica bacterium]|nr:glycosyltransferase family 2 protein [Candidatus Omnitrophota bacterium]MDD5652590.1 glycosyltransferase family 2 protein [Candidatus Omnitrophota bacterium]